MKSNIHKDELAFPIDGPKTARELHRSKEGRGEGEGGEGSLRNYWVRACAGLVLTPVRFILTLAFAEFLFFRASGLENILLCHDA